MRFTNLATWILSMATAGLVACGGETPPPETPPAPPAEPRPAVAEATPPPVEPKKEELAPAPAKKAAKEVLMSEGAMFMYSFNDSTEAKQAATTACEKKAKGDDQKKATCMQEQMAAAEKEGIRFEKTKEGKFAWVSFGKDKKDNEIIYNKITVNVANEDPSKVTLAPEGKDEGKKPLKKLPKEMVLEVPDESTVVMNDEKRGKLVFKKKLPFYLFAKSLVLKRRAFCFLKQN